MKFFKIGEKRGRLLVKVPKPGDQFPGKELICPTEHGTL